MQLRRTLRTFFGATGTSLWVNGWIRTSQADVGRLPKPEGFLITGLWSNPKIAIQLDIGFVCLLAALFLFKPRNSPRREDDKSPGRQDGTS